MQEAAFLITFTEETFNGIFFVCALFWDNRDHSKKCSVKKLFLEISQDSEGITSVLESLSFEHLLKCFLFIKMP